MERDPKLVISVSHTTRSPRPGEQAGREYHFVDDAEFLRLIEAGAFLEHARVFDRRYGTTYAAVEADLAAGRDVLVESFPRAGFPIPAPPATMFAWAPIPEAYAELGSVEFAKQLLEKTDVAVAPGLGFGERGDSHVRLALVENEQRIRQAARKLKGFFA